VTYVRNILDWFGNIFYTFGVAFITWALLALAVWTAAYYPKDNEVPILPIGYFTGIWLVALLLPLTSTFYLLFDLRLRRNQIEDAAQRGQIQFVYFANSQTALRDFSYLLRQRFRETCQPWELVAFSTIAGIIAFIGSLLVFYNAFEAIPQKQYYGLIDQSGGSRVFIFAGFAGSLAGAYVYIFNKFRTFDIYPSTYLQASIGFISGSLGAVFIGNIYDTKILGFIVFAIGFLTAVNVSFPSGLLRREFARLTGVKLPDDVAGDLDMIIQNAGAIESLHNIAVYSVGELVKADPLTIYLSLPAPLGVINGWLDEGLILYYFGRDNLDLLAKVGVKRFTQLLELAVEQWPATGTGIDKIKWKTKITLLGEEISEPMVREEVHCIIESRIHNRLLGILHDRYRESVFFNQSRG
jgi:hypothetical protein